MGTVEQKEACPRCFAKTGETIVLKREDDIWRCPKVPSHEFKMEDGFLKKIEKGGY